MNEPKKRGRPSKAELAARLSPFEHVPPSDVERAQAYAQRVWDGQSPDLDLDQRLGRVKRALEAQGLSMEGVVLP